jgi:tetraacyldisaccharide 4'-kinase
VVSIGNLHWGGTGKTPVTAAVAAHLRDRGLAVAILSRGYGREDHHIRVVSQGRGPLLGPATAGDEPVWLAGELPGVAVVVAPERYRAGVHALERLTPPPDLFLLDDGFSHLALARELDLVVLPAEDPWGGGRLPPSGRLREPLAALARAHALLLTGQPAEGDGERAARAVRDLGFFGPGFEVPVRARAPRFLNGDPLPAGARALLVGAIARPERFFAAARELPLTVVEELRFPDHHPFPDASLERITARFHQGGAEVVLATGKDRVKLQGRLDLPLAELPVAAAPGAAFWAWFDREIDVLVRAAAARVARP